jgi:hypothetical protein
MFLLVGHIGLSVAIEAASWGAAQRAAGGSCGAGGSRGVGGSQGAGGSRGAGGSQEGRWWGGRW